jgi:hypothetical protein
MKIFKYIGLSVLLVLTTTSCNDYLNVNVDTDNPSNTTASVSSRLPWIQHYFLYAQQCAGTRTAFICQQMTATSRTSRDGCSSGWQASTSLSTTPYQFFFIGCASNIQDLITKAESEGAYHYEAAAKVVRAMGFMLMQDLYGEMPYTEALSAAVTPKYDNGKLIFNGCLKDIDDAITLFGKTEEKGATALSDGDSWNNGDVSKWIALCYGLKARWLNNLSKKTGTYDTAAILAALAKAPQSNAESTNIIHQDVSSDNVGDILFGDPLYTSIVFNSCGENTNSRVTKWYTDLLTNFDGKSIEDPRADKLIPWAQVGTDKHWMRSQGVDMNTDMRMNNAPYPTAYLDKSAKPDTIVDKNKAILRIVHPGEWYCETTDQTRWNDSIYVSFRAGSIAAFATANDQYSSTDGTIMASGTFYSRPTGPTHLLCYPEMCFIKAEVLFNTDKAGSYAAYKAGIQADIDLMNTKLAAYSETSNPSKTVMSSTAISNFMNNAIGTAADLTLGKIMEQKFIAMAFSVQNWNDMRRYDYNTTAYPNWKIPYEYYQNSTAQTYINLGSQFRRIEATSIEQSYNANSWAASNKYATAKNIWQYPCWFDCATDAEYNLQMNTPVQ